MDTKLTRATKLDKFTQFIIDSGKFAVNASNPLTFCKMVLEQVEQNNENTFIENVMCSMKSADIKSLDAVKSMKRFYRVLQVVNKAVTQDKLNRFKKLTVNSIIKQDNISDDTFELFTNIIDELTDTEFIILDKIYNIEKEHEGEKFNPKQDEIKEKILSELNINIEIFESYVHRLKSKGLIVNSHGYFMDYNTPFYIDIVDGKTSEMAEKLLEFIENKAS